jgi:hypothetical protein
VIKGIVKGDAGEAWKMWVTIRLAARGMTCNDLEWIKLFLDILGVDD